MTRRLSTLLTALLLSTGVSLPALAQQEPSLPPLAPESVPGPEQPADPSPSSAPLAPAIAEKSLTRVTLNDGQVLRGHLVSQSEEAVVLQLVGGGQLTLGRQGIRSLETEEAARAVAGGQLRFRDPNRTRYFYTPSAMMLRKGEGYFSQKQLMFSSVAYGLTDHVTVLAGTMLPLWLINADTINFIGGIKAGISLHENFHLAAGAESLVLPMLSIRSNTLSAGGFLFAGATLGNPDAHLTVNVGTPFVVPTLSGSPNAIVTVSGNLRVGAHVALMTENWLMPAFLMSSTRLMMVNALGARFMGERWAVDVALMRLDSGTGANLFNALGILPFPWVDFTYNFG